MLITQYTGFDDKKIVIPSSIDGIPIIGIWNSAFEKCVMLEEVYLEEGCALEEISVSPILSAYHFID